MPYGDGGRKGMKRAVIILLTMMLLFSSVTIAHALSYDELLQKAEEYVVSEDYEKALACYDMAIKLDQDKPDAFIAKGKFHLNRGEYPEAYACAESALALDSTLADGWLLRCLIDIASGDTEAFDSDAIYAGICGAELSPYAGEIGSIYVSAGIYDKALEYFSESSLDGLNETQKKYYCRTLIASGNKDKAEELGLVAERVRNESLDAAFESGYPKLVETDTSSLKPTFTDFELTEELKSMGGSAYPEDSLREAIEKYEFTLLSKSPTGNSGIVLIDTTLVTLYEGKYHVIFPSEQKSVEDTYQNLVLYYQTISTRGISLIGDEGVAYSPDGKYAAIYNSQLVFMRNQFICDPILLNLATGELILTATSPNKWSDDGMSAVTTAMFSADGRYFYYMLYGKFGDGHARLCRYDLSSKETEICLDTNLNTYYPHLSELEDGSLLILNDSVRTDEAQSFVAISNQNGKWISQELEFELGKPYFFTNRLNYSSNSGYVCLLNKMPTGATITFQIVLPEQGFKGADRYLCLTKDTNEIVSLSAQEYQMAIDEDTNGTNVAELRITPKCPYQTVLNAVLSPDGNYVLLSTYYITMEGEQIRNLYLVRLNDMTVQKVRGIDAESIQVRSQASYPICIEWNTDELIVGTRDGVKTYEFVSGSPEDDMPEVDNRSDEEKKIDELEADIEKQKKRIESDKTKLQRWVDGGKKSEEDIQKQREKIEKEKAKLAALEEELLALEGTNQ